MNDFVIVLGWIGLYAPMALGAVGSIMGCAVAGQAAIGAMLDTDSGYGRYVGGGGDAVVTGYLRYCGDVYLEQTGHHRGGSWSFCRRRTCRIGIDV